jgi:formylglycine-generating enzyme required for sulfatase activity
MPNRWTAALIALSITAFGGAVVADAEAQTMQAGQTFRDCSDCPEMVVVPAGSFLMGSSAEDTARDLNLLPIWGTWIARIFFLTAREHPQHPVTIARPFALGKYLVTRAEFATFVRETGYSMASWGCIVIENHRIKRGTAASWEHPDFTQTDRDPVLCVSWNDAQAYVAWLNAKLQRAGKISTEGNGPYRLPSEAEWEYAARAGTRMARWWGDVLDAGDADCDGCGSQWDNKQTAPVGNFSPNPFGLYDMLGNASEWTADCANGSYTGAPEDGTAWTTGNCAQRINRGGGWDGDPFPIRSAARAWEDAGEFINDVGFRVARTLP